MAPKTTPKKINRNSKRTAAIGTKVQPKSVAPRAPAFQQKENDLALAAKAFLSMPGATYTLANRVLIQADKDVKANGNWKARD